jgi:formylglycine-generating enzyme required for sulfatase activity
LILRMTLPALLCNAGRAMADDASSLELLKEFVSELILVTPGKAPFPRSIELDGRRLEPTTPIRIAKFETTQRLYEFVMGSNPSRWKGPRNSVEMVSYDEANAFCKKLTQLLRKEKLIDADEDVRLPTELEWEYCCRAGTTTRYSFGDDASKLGDFAWTTDNAAGNDPPVGAKKPNPWGLFDVHGYLWEWCGVDPDGKEAPARGGAWTSTAAECRSDSRVLSKRDRRSPDLGFRCVVRTVAAPKP